jgi:hypothetical protein
MIIPKIWASYPKSWPWHMLSAPPSRRLRASTSIQEIRRQPSGPEIQNHHPLGGWEQHTWNQPPFVVVCFVSNVEFFEFLTVPFQYLTLLGLQKVI